MENINTMDVSNIKHTLKDNFTIIEKVGKGMQGKVYKIKFDDGTQMALKIEKIANKYLEPQMLHSTKVREWRDIEFQSFANTYPDQFTEMYDYDYQDGCVYEYSSGYYKRFEKLPDDIKIIYKEKEEGTYCIRKLYYYVDTILQYVGKTTLAQEYSMCTQMIYAFHLMQLNGYVHGDIHIQNIGVNYVDPTKTLKILNVNLKTFGRQVRLFDFGRVLNTKYELNEEELLLYKYEIKNEINKYISLLVSFRGKKQNLYLIQWNKNLDFFNEWLKSDQAKLVQDYGSNDFDRYLIYQMLYPEMFQRKYYGNEYKGTCQLHTKIKLNDILFIFKNKENLEMILRYMINKTNKFNK